MDAKIYFNWKHKEECRVLPGPHMGVHSGSDAQGDKSREGWPEQWAITNALLCNWVICIHNCEGHNCSRRPVLLLVVGGKQAPLCSQPGPLGAGHDPEESNSCHRVEKGYTSGCF